MNDEGCIEALYQGLLERPSDPGGKAHFLAHLRRTGDLTGIVRALLDSDEFRARRPTARSDHTEHRLRLEHFARHLQRPIGIVDIGAQALASEEHIYAPLLALPSHVVGFEPVEAHHARLKGQMGDRLQLHASLVGDGADHVFHANNDDATSSLLPLNIEFNAAFNHLRELTTVARTPVATRRLDDVLDRAMPVDFLKLDIQGFELPVLRHAELTLARTLVVHCEASFAPLYHGASLFSDIERFLDAHGFDFIDLTHEARYAYVDVPHASDRAERLIWGDAIFLSRRSGAGREQALIAAAIMSLVYGKSGIAQHVLRLAGCEDVLRGLNPSG